MKLTLQIKRNLLLVCFLAYGIACQAQALNEYRSIATGNWNVLSTWQRYNGTTWVAATAIPTSAHATITVLSGHTITITGAVTLDQVVVAGTLIVNAGVIYSFNNGAGNDLTISSGGVLMNNGTINNIATTIIFNSGTFNNNLTINNNGTITNDGTLNNNVGATLTNNLSFNVNATKSFNNYGTFINGVAGTTTNNGTITNTAVFTNSGTHNENSGSFYKHNPVTGSGAIPTATWNAASTLEILGTGGNASPPTGLNQSFGSFTWNHTTQTANINLLGQLNNVFGTFRMQSTNFKELRLDSTSNVTLTVYGDMILNSGTLVLTAGTGVFAVDLKGNYVQSAPANMDMSRTVTASTLNIGKSFQHIGGTFGETGTSIGNNLRINGTVNGITQSLESIGFVSTGGPALNSIDIYIMHTGTTHTANIAAGKTFVLNSGTSLTVNNNASTATDLTINGTLITNTLSWILNSGSTTVIGSTGIFSNTTTGPISDNSTATTLTCNNGGTFRVAGDGGQAATATWQPTSNLEVTGLINSDTVGNCNQLFGQILWNSISQTTSASFSDALLFASPVFGTQGSFTVSSTGTGTLRFPDLNFTVGANLTVQNDSKLQISNAIRLYAPVTRTFIIMGDASVSGTALLTVGSPNTGGVIGGGDKVRDYVFSLKGDFLHSSTTPIIGLIHRSYSAATNDDQYRLTLDFTGGTSQSISMAPTTMNLTTISGDGAANSGTDDEFYGYNVYKINSMTANTRLIGLSDLKYTLMTVGATDTLDMTSGTFNLYHYPSLNSTGAAQVSSTVVSATGVFDFGLATLYDATGSGIFNIAANAELRTKHAQGIAPVAAGAIGCIQTGTRSYNAASNYTYNGSTNQVTGTGLPAVLTGILEIDNSTPLASGGVTLSQATAINGGATKPVTLTQGKLITASAALLTLNNLNTVSPVGGSPTSFVDGPVKKIGFTAATEFIFPTGDVDKWARLSVTPSANSGTNAFTAEYIKSDPHAIDTALNYTVANRQLNRISYKEYWQLAQSAGTPAAKVKLFWEDGAFSGITLASNTDLRVAHYYNPGTGLKWYGETTVAPVVTGTTTSGTVETAGALTSFSPFTLGSRNSINPLPIELLTFNGHATGMGNQLFWTTATETNNDHFELERSQDENFSKIATIAGHGNSQTNIDYDFLDVAPFQGINYYRLKQVDHDGKASYSNVISILNETTESNVMLYPNPTNDQINIVGSGDITSIEIYNSLGQLVFSKTPGLTEVIVFQPLSSGVYVVKATGASGKVISSRFIKN